MNRRRPPFHLLPRVTRCEQLGLTYLRWGRRLWFSYDTTPAPAPPPPVVPWPVAAFRILTLATAAWIVAVPVVVAAIGEMPARILP